MILMSRVLLLRFLQRLRHYSPALPHLQDQYYCPGYKIVEDRRIRCHKAGGHGAEDFTHALENTCNPASDDDRA